MTTIQAFGEQVTNIQNTDYKDSKFETDGTFLTTGLYRQGNIEQAQREILALLSAANGESIKGIPNRIGDFLEISEHLITKILSSKPQMRKPLIQALRKLPGVQSLATNPSLIEVLKWTGLNLPIIRLQSLQVFLPWEEVFHEREHQDFGGLLSHTGWTIQVALQPVIKETTGAAEIFPTTYRHGPLEHRIRREPNGYSYEVVDDKYYRDIEPINFDMNIGDATLFNCFSIHRSYPTQNRIRWSMVIRIDEGVGSNLIEHGSESVPDGALRCYDYSIWSNQLEKFFKEYSVPPKYRI